MNKYLLLSVCSCVFWLAGCANVKLVSSDANKYKFCTNAGNQVAKASDFDEAAGKKCGNKYKKLHSGLEFFTDPNSAKIGGALEVQTQRRMCYVYECTKQ